MLNKKNLKKGPSTQRIYNVHGVAAGKVTEFTENLIWDFNIVWFF